MHGRLKTISTEEQKLRQQENRLATLEAYRNAISIIQKKRNSKEYDDEALQITRDMLVANPDITTLWNFRREIFLSLKSEIDQESLQKKLEDDLFLTESCLRVNPKSYGSWHHREWILKEMPTCDWQKEILLCNKYLSYDERNFHCWDYRRMVVKNAHESDLSEYNFTTEKIQSNFSNYSAWHYRSKLLPLLFPHPDGKFSIADNVHKDELDLVQNAAFTDPDDQSAWFYQRWLLNLRQSPVGIVHASVKSNWIVVTLSHAIRNDKGFTLNASIDETTVTAGWQGTAGTMSAVWKLPLPQDVKSDTLISISLDVSEASAKRCVDSLTITSTKSVNRPPPLSVHNSDLKETLQEQLNCCQQLLELEPDSKWTLLTCQLLMQFIDPIGHKTEIVKVIEKLGTVDPLRSGYYRDMISKFKIGAFLKEHWSVPNFNLSGMNLTCLFHSQYFVNVLSLDLSRNSLTDQDLKQLHSLVNCNDLNLSRNQIRSLKFLPILNKLKKLSCEENQLSDKLSDLAHLKLFFALTDISL